MNWSDKDRRPPNSNETAPTRQPLGRTNALAVWNTANPRNDLRGWRPLRGRWLQSRVDGMGEKLVPQLSACSGRHAWNRSQGYTRLPY
jgi:hypothetical protein